MKIYILSVRRGCEDPECCNARLIPEIAFKTLEEAKVEEKKILEDYPNTHIETNIDTIELRGVVNE